MAKQRRSSAGSNKAPVSAVDATKPLSPAEMQVVLQVATGKTYQEIADELGVSFETVRTYLKRIRKKLKVNSQVQILVWAYSKNLISRG